MYSRNHPYYPQPQPCIWLKLAKGGAEARLGWFFNAEGVKCPGDCNECKYAPIVGNKQAKHELFLNLQKDDNFKNVEEDPHSGGVRGDNKHHNFKSNGEQFFKDENGGKGWTGTQLEVKCQEHLFRTGHSCILMPEKTFVIKGKEKTALAIKIDGILIDIRSVTKESEHYLNRVTSKDEQLVKWNAQKPNEKSDSLCLYFHKSELYSKDKADETINRIHRMQESGREFAIKTIYCVVNGHFSIYKYTI